MYKLFVDNGIKLPFPQLLSWISEASTVFFSPPSHLPRPKKSSGSVRSQGYSSAFSSLPRLLQTPQAQRLERDVADFTLAPQVTWKFDLQGDFLERKDRKVARNNPRFLLEKMST